MILYRYMGIKRYMCCVNGCIHTHNLRCSLYQSLPDCIASGGRKMWSIQGIAWNSAVDSQNRSWSFLEVTVEQKSAYPLFSPTDGVCQGKGYIDFLVFGFLALISLCLVCCCLLCVLGLHQSSLPSCRFIQCCQTKQVF